MASLSPAVDPSESENGLQRAPIAKMQSVTAAVKLAAGGAVGLLGISTAHPSTSTVSRTKVPHLWSASRFSAIRYRDLSPVYREKPREESLCPSTAY